MGEEVATKLKTACAIPDCITNTKSVMVTTTGTIDQLQNVLNCDM